MVSNAKTSEEHADVSQKPTPERGVPEECQTLGDDLFQIFQSLQERKDLPEILNQFKNMLNDDTQNPGPSNSVDNNSADSLGFNHMVSQRDTVGCSQLKRTNTLDSLMDHDIEKVMQRNDGGVPATTASPTQILHKENISPLVIDTDSNPIIDISTQKKKNIEEVEGKLAYSKITN